jgi:hypothetical protein
MEENFIKVYVKLDKNNVITDINSSVFLSDLTEWVEIDSGNGDKYSHSQSNYLDKGLTDSNEKYNYKLADSKVLELTDTEKEILFPTPALQPTEDEILRAKILKDNADMQLQLIQQQQINANLLTQIAKLGGTTNG